MSDTPETDTEKFGSLCGNDWNGWRLGDVVPAALSRRLERERNALNTKCEQIGRQLVVAERELAEAREDAADWKVEYEIVAARLRGEKHPRDNGIIAKDEIIPKLIYERDEAREALEERDKEWFQVIESFAGFHPVSITDALKQGIKWKKALKSECDEARAEVARLREALERIERGSRETIRHDNDFSPLIGEIAAYMTIASCALKEETK